jgi:hypothetical protein
MKFPVLARGGPVAVALLALALVGSARAATAPASPTGILYDRVLPLSHIERYDGRTAAPPARPATWWQIYDELRRAADSPTGPDPLALRERARQQARSGVIPLALLDYRYERLTPDAAGRTGSGGAPVAGEPRQEARAFAAAALTDVSYRGADLAFVLDRAFWFGNAGAPSSIEADFDDARGFRPLRLDQPCRVSYATTGQKAIRLRARFADGAVREAGAAFTVATLSAPSPNDTLHVTATIPYLGQYGTGDAYVYLAPGRTALLNPVVVVEGFDIDNSYNWDELYQLLNQQNLIETLRADGYDAVVLNFTEATDYLQKNAFVLTELLQEVQAAVGPQTSVALVGPSMGGLVSRYALAYMEGHGIPHHVRTFVSFDAPHKGADIPLGIQYWMKLFSSQSADAAFLLSRLDQPGARQMLVYHYTDPPGSTGQADPLRAGFLADLAAAGDFPTGPRMVAVANGSGSRVGQGFAPGDQIIRYEYSVPFLTTIRGNVWAVPDQTSHVIFDGRIFVLFSTNLTQNVTVSGTQPFDSAPGGWRATMTQMDTTAVPYGDIIALHPSHCFIPTISALALDSNDLFYDIAGDPGLLTHTPFDAVYFPAANQEHVTITPENAVWLRAEIESGVTAVGPPTAGAWRTMLAPAAPNPFGGQVRLRFALPAAADVDLRVFGLDGGELARLAGGTLGAGVHDLTWSGRDAGGREVASGIYFVRLAVEGHVETQRIVHME